MSREISCSLQISEMKFIEQTLVSDQPAMGIVSEEWHVLVWTDSTNPKTFGKIQNRLLQLRTVPNGHSRVSITVVFLSYVVNSNV